MVNGCDRIYYEKEGKIRLSEHTITSNIHLKNIIERIVTPLGRRIDEKTPYVDARLADGSRVHAIIEPLAMDGPALTIRKFPADRITVEDYVYRFHSLTKEMADFMEICVSQGLNVVISGGTGSGKTTLLNVLSGFIPTTERIITVEDAAELQLKQEHVVRLETRPANMEGVGEVSIRDLIRNTLRMRPDRIVVGECRDGAALDMLAAMNTGHDGSLTTVHANTPREAVAQFGNPLSYGRHGSSRQGHPGADRRSGGYDYSDWPDERRLPKNQKHYGDCGDAGGCGHTSGGVSL